MKISLIAAKSENNVIGNGAIIPWAVKGEQLIFKALTFHQWVLVGRKTFASMGVLPNRKYAVITRSTTFEKQKNVIPFNGIETALAELSKITDTVFIAGGGQIYTNSISEVDVIHVSTIHKKVAGDIYFPEIPENFTKIFTQHFTSNIDYTYEIWQKS